MRRKYNIFGLVIPAKNGGLMFCDKCEKIVGSINAKGYRFLSFSLTCTCSNECQLELIRKSSTFDIAMKYKRKPHIKNNLMSCVDCGTPIFGIIEERVEKFSFNAECICGAKYDTKARTNRRLEETVLFLKYKNRSL